MKSFRSKIAIVFCVAIAIGTIDLAIAQTVTVSLGTEYQTIRGFGGMNCPTWGVNLTTDQTTTAFGNGSGQIGMTILRMMVNPSSGSWSGELTVAKKAVSLGAITFASPWNAPSSMASGGHVTPSSYAAYADHLNSFVSYMKTNGVDLYAISVQNEPDYGDWTHWTAQEMFNFVKNNGGSIKTRLIAPESFQFVKSMSDPILNDSVALANLSILGAHLYGTSVNNFAYPLFKQKGAGKELWMTEHYTESNNDADAWPLALDVAYELHNCMVEAQFNAYIWWYIRRSYGPIKENGQVSKRGWCMAQWAKFVRPGFKRVDATKNPTASVYVSAYKNGDQVVIVAVNRNTSSKSLSFSIAGTKVTSFAQYTTSGSKSMADDGNINVSGENFSANIDASSVSTWVGNITVGVKNCPSPAEDRTDFFNSLPAKSLSGYQVFDLKGRRINKNQIDAFKGRGVLQNFGIYIIREEKSGSEKYLKVSNK